MNSRTPKDKYRDDASRKHGHRSDGGDAGSIREAGKAGASAARHAAQSRLEEGKTAASGAATSAARALDEAASSLSSQDQESLARVTSSLAEQLSRLAQSLEQRNVDELSRDARRLAREHPGLFVAGGVALGLAMSRFFKASGERPHTSHRDAQDADQETSKPRPVADPAASRDQRLAANSARTGDIANP